MLADEFIPHSLKQQNAILSDHKITLALTGIQFGKTTIGSVWTKRLMHTHRKKEDTFIITAPNYKIMQQSTLPSFLRRMDGAGEYRKADALFEMTGGGVCYMRTATEPDSIVGITNVRAIWGDEAGKYSLYFWENIQARASFRNCPIMLTTTPYTSNWIFKDLVRKTRDGKRDDVYLVEASSNENPFFPQEEFERRKRTMDPRRFAALYEGQFEKMHGLVYDCFDEDSHVVKPFELPQGTRYYAGVDWGYTDPFVLVVRAVTPTGHHFQVSEFYKTGLTITDIIQIARQKKQTYGIHTFWADPSQPGYIEEFNRNGLSCLPADNDIRRGVDLHYDLIRSGRYQIFEGTSPYTIDEMSGYHYPEPEDLEPDEDSKEQLPVGQDDHSLDANRYCTVMTYRSATKHVPKTPSETKDTRHMTHEKRIDHLKRKNRTGRGSENWS